ncbi:MAG TPA: peptigoglycan-binding protein LysM, partial [Gammaproteobacteria bacterium]|nr:peptigoglycan-binding protein LysM [Gammaproteobacteria bacterium]
SEEGSELESGSGTDSVDQDILSEGGEEAVARSDEDLLKLDDELEDLEDEDLAFPSFSEYDAMAEDDELLDDVDEIGTKLDLARAYIDMGDAEAARSMLDEVKEEGDKVQKQEATELLEQIDA